ncbi:MAG: cytochrome P460 family protein [Chloroflexota bacterium]
MHRPILFSSALLGLAMGTLVIAVVNSPLHAPTTSAQTAPSKPAPSEDRVGFPDGYESWPLLYVFDRPDNKSVRLVYGNTQAASANPSAPPNEVFAYGSILVMESWRARVDANGAVELDHNGRFQKGVLTGIFVERKEPGFGEAYQVARAGEWEWVAYRPDRTYLNAPAQTTACAVCHQDAGATRDWVMRANLYFSGLSGAVPTMVDSVATSGRIPIQSYTFLPPSAIVPTGTTVTWGNDDPIAHTVTWADRAVDSGRMGPGSTFSYTFSQPGTYEYFCALHQNMKGTVIVQ